MTEAKAALVGTKFRGERAIAAVGKMRTGDAVRLVREPDNQHDENAIACWFGGMHVGYLSRIANPRIASAIDRGAADVRAFVDKPANIVGVRVRGEPLLAVRWSDNDG